MVSKLSTLFIFFFCFILIRGQEPTPTNKPQICLGNPVCSGPKQGYCKENVGCVCISPWSGSSCSSKVIVVPQPSLQPPIIEIFNDNNDYTILITEIRELDINNNMVKSFILNNWVLTSNSPNISNYKTTIVQGGGATTTVNVTKEFFKDQGFSKIKYSVNLSPYAFTSQLNSLQIIFKVQIQLNETNNTICSSKEYGFTTQPDDSSYIRLQVSNSTLLSRFPNSCLVDDKILSISPIGLDSDDLKSKSNNVVSYIGIPIPFYVSSIIFNPDFSFSLEKVANSSSPNSVCSSSEDSQSSTSLSENSESSTSSSLSSFLFKEFTLFDLSETHNYYATTGNVCYTVFIILVTNSTEPIENLNNGIGCSITSQNKTATLFTCTSYVYVGTNQINFAVNNDLLKGDLTTNFECKDFQVNSYNIIQEVTWSSILKFSSIVKLDDFPDSVSISEFYDASLFIITSLGQNMFRIKYTEKYYILKTSNFSNWETELKFSNNKNLTISVPYNATKYIGSNTNSHEILNLKTNPTGGASVEGEFLGTIITFQSSSLLQRVVYPVVILNQGIYYYYFSKPIYGNLGNMTYICNVAHNIEKRNDTLLRRKEDSTFETFIFKTNLKFIFINIVIAGSPIPSSSYSNVPIEIGTLNMFSIEISTGVTYNHQFNQFYKGNQKYSLGAFKSFPYGFLKGSNPNYVIGTSVPVSGLIYQTNYSYICKTEGSIGLNISVIPLNSNAELSIPQLIDSEVIHLTEFKFLIRFTVLDKYGINYIQIPTNEGQRFNQYYSDKLISGSIKNGVFEIVYDIVKFGLPTTNEIIIKNNIELYNTIKFENSFTLNNLSKKFNFPSINLNYNYLNDIKNISFYVNDIDIVDKTVDNIIYFSFDNNNLNLNYTKDLIIGFTLIDPKSLRDINFQSGEEVFDLNFYPIYKFAIWDEINSRYYIKFKVPANTSPSSSVLDWMLVFNKENFITNTQLSDEYQLRIKDSNFDCYGPIVTNIIKISNSTILGWLFTIEDEINGFKDGYVTVRGLVDNSLYNITLKLSDMVIGSGDKWRGDYLINITQTGECVEQEFTITYALFTDTFGNVNKYFKWVTENELIMNKNYIIDGTANPFLNFLNDQSILKISTINSICFFSDATPPELVYFTASTTEMDVGAIDRSITFNFQAYDPDGLKDDQNPIVYITDTDSRVEECISTTIISKNFTHIEYTCTMEVPIGFSHPYGFLLSVYGFINRGGMYQGYSSTYLKALNFNWYVSTVSLSTSKPIITDSSAIDNDGGDFWLYGRGLKSTSTAKVFFNNSDSQIFTINPQYDSAILVKNIPPTNNQFIIQLIGSDSSSNNFTITPTIYNFQFSTPTPTQTPTPTPTLSTPTPTNKPQICLGNPLCGGSKQGYCKENVGCICYSPYVGLDCSSKIIIIPQPKPNEDKPTTAIDNKNNNSSNVNNNYQVTSNISIIAIREVNSINGEQVKIHYIDKWYYNSISPTISNYQSTIINNNITTIINVTLEWFENKSNITFANQELIMNPSTIKYTVELSSYKFSNKLNNLQVIIEAQIQSNENDICSGKEFGDTTLDNSNYIKLQVSSNSIYGRFLKRGIVDGKIVTITNELLDSKLNSISNENNVQSYIGIVIGQYETSVIIDPDFSLLLDNQAINSNSPNSICASSESSLTKGQLIGIIIGSFIFFVSAIIIILKIAHSKSLRFKIFVYKTFRKSKK
ncbi:hypothetical protein ACTFIZ_006279 [Dictyostelium cf. discoideum]